jgi:hypothetical protein
VAPVVIDKLELGPMTTSVPCPEIVPPCQLSVAVYCGFPVAGLSPIARVFAPVEIVPFCMVVTPVTMRFLPSVKMLLSPLYPDWIVSVLRVDGPALSRRQLFVPLAALPLKNRFVTVWVNSVSWETVVYPVRRRVKPVNGLTPVVWVDTGLLRTVPDKLRWNDAILQLEEVQPNRERMAIPRRSEKPTDTCVHGFDETNDTREHGEAPDGEKETV